MRVARVVMGVLGAAAVVLGLFSLVGCGPAFVYPAGTLLAAVDEQKSLHPWHQEIPVTARAPSVEKADLLLIVGEETEKVLSVHEYQSGGVPAPSITRYQHCLDVKLIDTKAGKTVADGHLRGPAPRAARQWEDYWLTRLDGGPVSFEQGKAWLSRRGCSRMW